MGRRPKLTPHQAREALRRRDHGDETLADIRRSYNVSGWTIGRLANMTAIILHRVDLPKNMHRFYRLDVQRDLFGAWCLIREWGRISSAGQMRSIPYATPAEAQKALAVLLRKKGRRGYSSVSVARAWVRAAPGEPRS